MVSLLSVLFCGFICLRGSRVSSPIQILMALFLIIGIIVMFFAVFLKQEIDGPSPLEPLFSPERAPSVGVLFIVFLAPWAFAGFESVSHSAEEFRFPVKKSAHIFAVSLLTSAAAYIALTLIAAGAQPEGFRGWVDYRGSLGGLSGDGCSFLCLDRRSALQVLFLQGLLALTHSYAPDSDPVVGSGASVGKVPP